jgi:hypothetical protein
MEMSSRLHAQTALFPGINRLESMCTVETAWTLKTQGAEKECYDFRIAEL